MHECVRPLLDPSPHFKDASSNCTFCLNLTACSALFKSTGSATPRTHGTHGSVPLAKKGKGEGEGEGLATMALIVRIRAPCERTEAEESSAHVGSSEQPASVTNCRYDSNTLLFPFACVASACFLCCPGPSCLWISRCFHFPFLL